MTPSNIDIIDMPPEQTIALVCRQEQQQKEYQLHQHPWGQLIYIKSGVLILESNGQRFIAPPKFAIWIPPQQQHGSYNRHEIIFRLINIAAPLCQALPSQACLLAISPLLHEIIEDYFQRNIAYPQSEADLRLSYVLIDQLSVADVHQTYLPFSQDKLLKPILTALEQQPADNTPLATWAKRVYSTERTIARRCTLHLGMSFNAWRQRLRFLHGLSLLEQGKSVQEVALTVGYSTSSAFINMFQQIAGTTPERYRKRE